MVDLFIKDVDEEVYRNFKSQAIQRGKKRKDAIEEAMRLWIEEKMR